MEMSVMAQFFSQFREQTTEACRRVKGLFQSF
jgi:hypothetical protein